MRRARDILEQLRNEKIERGFVTDVINSRGEVTRSIGEGAVRRSGWLKDMREANSHSAVAGTEWPAAYRLAATPVRQFGGRAPLVSSQAIRMAERRRARGPPV